MINAISIALSGLLASSKRVDVSASNIANVSTTGALDPADGAAPYSALTTEQVAQGNGGVSVAVRPKSPPFVPGFDPSSDSANADGVVGVPNVDLAEEIVSLKVAALSYKANLAVIETENDLQNELMKSVDRRV